MVNRTAFNYANNYDIKIVRHAKNLISDEHTLQFHLYTHALQIISH